MDLRMMKRSEGGKLHEEGGRQGEAVEDHMVVHDDVGSGGDMHAGCARRRKSLEKYKDEETRKGARQGAW